MCDESAQLNFEKGYGDFNTKIAEAIISKLGGYLKKHPNFNQIYFGDTQNKPIIYSFIENLSCIHPELKPIAFPTCVAPTKSVSVVFKELWTYRPYKLGNVWRISFSPCDVGEMREIYEKYGEN